MVQHGTARPRRRPGFCPDEFYVQTRILSATSLFAPKVLDGTVQESVTTSGCQNNVTDVRTIDCQNTLGGGCQKIAMSEQIERTTAKRTCQIVITI